MNFIPETKENLKADTAVIFLFEDRERTELFDYFDSLSNGELSKQVFQYNIFKGGFGECYKFAINENLKIFLYGLGKKNLLTRKKFSQMLANAGRTIKNQSKNKTAAVEVINFKNEKDSFNVTEALKMEIPALRIGLYEFSKYLHDKKPAPETIELIVHETTDEIKTAIMHGKSISNAMKFAKDLVNESAQIVTPGYVAKTAEEIAKKYNLEAQILNKDEIKALGMNAFLAVGQGSVNEPKFVHLTYKPNVPARKKIALIGKGITFDAGGMNIKPASSMLTMKSDMTGAASVLGIIQAIAETKSDIELHVITALCENMTSGSAYKQGDVLTAMNGKTIEVDNTDAEGRITLADALTFADTLNVDEVIDIATLTGAVIVSLGHNITGVLGNNQKQIDKFIEISKQSCENTWQMPILEELKDNLKSEIADFKNTGGRNAGTSTAAWFLSNFTKSKSWLHLDIAGTAYLEKSNKETLSGPTGVMIRTLINYLNA